MKPKLHKTKKVTECGVCHSKNLKLITFDIEHLDLDPAMEPIFSNGYKCKDCNAVTSILRNDNTIHVTFPQNDVIFVKTSDYAAKVNFN